MFKNYLEIVKPGIVIGNIISIIGSFVFASHHFVFDVFLFLYTIFGASLIIASACVCNNLIDRDIDKKMMRTRERVLSRNIISFRAAIIFSIVLGILGFCMLGFLVNYLSMLIAMFGFLIYVVFYTLIKRISIYSTLIGSFAGATPSVIGYVAVSNKIDMCSILLFIILIFWQMSHFYSIAIFRYIDYKNANIPIFSVVKGIDKTKQHVFFYIFAFCICSSLLTLLSYLSYIFLFFSSIINIYWLFLSYCSIKKKYIYVNTHKLFYYSIIVIIVFNFLIALDIVF